MSPSNSLSALQNISTNVSVLWQGVMIGLGWEDIQADVREREHAEKTQENNLKTAYDDYVQFPNLNSRKNCTEFCINLMNINKLFSFSH